MNDADGVLFRQAEALAQSGQMQAAYSLFRQLHDKGSQDVNILVGIAYTTIDADEASEAIATIKQMELHHPQLKSLEALHQSRRMSTTLLTGPVLHCPYCGQRAPALVKSKISVGGWVWFAAFFVVFICFMTVPVPVKDMPAMEGSGFFCLAVGIIGLFAIRKRTYACGHCRAKITDAG